MGKWYLRRYGPVNRRLSAPGRLQVCQIAYSSVRPELIGRVVVTALRNYLKTACALGGALRQAQGERITRFAPLTTNGFGAWRGLCNRHSVSTGVVSWAGERGWRPVRSPLPYQPLRHSLQLLSHFRLGVAVVGPYRDPQGAGVQEGVNLFAGGVRGLTEDGYGQGFR